MTVYRILGALLFILSTISAQADFHVSPTGSDTNPGTESSPFLTLERARDAIRSLKEKEDLPEGGIKVWIHPGNYTVKQSFQLTTEDSGSADAPLIYCAFGPETPRFSGGIRLDAFTLLDDPETLNRLPESARGSVMTADLDRAGVAEIIPLELGGFSSGRGFTTHPVMELYVNGEPMVPSRWPNEGFVQTGEVMGPATLKAWDNRPGSPEGRFKYLEDRPAAWVNEPDAWLYGYWFWDWADSYEKIERIDAETREITLAQPWHRYGYRQNQRYYAVNLLCELDVPGEWYLDRTKRKVYLFPKSSLDGAIVELSTVPFPLMEAKNLCHVRFQGITWECGAADGVRIESGEDCRLEGCIIRKMAGNGVEIKGGFKHSVQSCDIHTLGRGGIVLSGGDRKTLTPGEHLVENCHIHHLSRIDHTYTPGVLVDGVGNRVRHTLIHDVASSAFRVGGNEHLFEFNEVFRAVLESDDQGGADMWGNPTFRGNVYRHNYWHHLGNPAKESESAHSMQAGIRLDDAICGTLIEGNIFHRCSTAPTLFGGVQIHGGKDNLIQDNLFVDNAAAVSFSPWGDTRWREFVAAALEAPEIDRDLYLERYPALVALNEGHDINTVRDNIALRCDALFLRAPEGTVSENNTEYPEGKELSEGPDGRLIWSETEAQQLGLEGLLFAKMGLYEDPWRQGPDTEWSLRASAK
ncbi:MAG: right-handed parallel beta-helix repeat-containing protein [Candidatus Hydrogenedentes bacterium]|nr:right-handed parallel beta-helix repeat-containing protein [Candidatus Hydrogenedentota bacterium]